MKRTQRTTRNWCGLAASLALLVPLAPCEPVAAADPVIAVPAMRIAPDNGTTSAQLIAVGPRRYGGIYPAPRVYRPYVAPYSAYRPYYNTPYVRPYYTPAPYGIYGGYNGYYAPYGTYYRGPVFRGGYYW